MNRQSAGAQLRLGMPLAAIRDAVAQVGEGGEERLYLEVPLAPCKQPCRRWQGM